MCARETHIASDLIGPVLRAPKNKSHEDLMTNLTCETDYFLCGVEIFLDGKFDIENEPQIEMKEIEDVEARIADLEVEIKLVRNAMIKNGNVNTTKRALNEE